jgi:hypothetical protein
VIQRENGRWKLFTSPKVQHQRMFPFLYEPSLSEENLGLKICEATNVEHMADSRAECKRLLRQKAADICDKDV